MVPTTSFNHRIFSTRPFLVATCVAMSKPVIHSRPFENPDSIIVMAEIESINNRARTNVPIVLHMMDHAGKKSTTPKCDPSSSAYVLEVLVMCVVPDRHRKRIFDPKCPWRTTIYPTTDVYS